MPGVCDGLSARIAQSSFGRWSYGAPCGLWVADVGLMVLKKIPGNPCACHLAAIAVEVTHACCPVAVGEQSGRRHTAASLDNANRTR
jgi:hypothetical protein